jgi:hypothetical protein
MKSLLLSTVFFFAGTALFSQSIPVGQVKLVSLGSSSASAEKNGTPNQTFSTIDTADQYILRATGGTFYLAPNGGYAFGTGYYFDTQSSTLVPFTDESGLEFDAVGSATVTDLIFWAGAKYINGAPDNINAKIYDIGPDSMPVNLLGTASMSMQDVDTGLSAVFTMINFPGGVNITGDYFISFEYAGIDDTIGFVTTGPGDGQMELRIRQKLGAFFGSPWLRVSDIYTMPFPALDVDFFWAPIYTLLDDGTNDHFTLKNNATVQPLYPTVATTDIHLDYSLPAASTVSYYIFDLKGRRYFETKSEQQKAGTYSQTFDVSTLAAGNYFVAVTINGQMITQKAVVTR